MNSGMRILLVTVLFLTSPGLAVTDSVLEQQLDLARKAEDTHAEIELLRRWLDIHPNDSAAAEKLVGLWMEVSDFDMAQQTLQQTVSPDPGLIARTHAEVAWRRDDNRQEALKILKARAVAAPAERDTLLLLVEYLGKVGERTEQITLLDALINEETSLDLLLDRAEAKLAADDPKGALADFRQAATDGPDEPRVTNARPGYERLESTLSAEDKLAKLPASPVNHFNKSYFWFYGGLPKRGLVEAQEGLKVWPDSIYGKILEARGLVADGSLTAAKAREERHVDTSTPLEDEKARQGILQSDAVLAKNRGTLQALINRGSWLNYCGQYALAMEDIQAALKIDPANVSAIHYAAVISLRQGNFPAATAYAEKINSLKAPADLLTDVYAGLAQMAFEQSNLQLALDFADKALSAKPTALVWKLKAACHTRLGQPNDAADALKKAEKGTP